MRSNPWYNSQVLAQVGNNLAAAIYGDPDAKYRRNQDARAERELTMRELNNTRAVEANMAKQRALEQIGQQFPEVALASQAGIPIGDMFSAMAENDPRFLQKIKLLVKQDGIGDANRTADFANKQALNQDLFNYRLTEQALGHGYNQMRDQNLFNNRITEQALGHGYDVNLAHINNIADLGQALVRGRSSGAPLDVSPSDQYGMNQMLEQMLADMANDPKYNIDPAQRQQMQMDAGALYQETRSVPAALSDILGNLDVTKRVDGWFSDTPGSVTYRRGETPTQPPGGADPSVSQAQPGSRDNPVKVTSMDEAMRLPKGAYFYSPDGKLRVR